MPVSCVLFYNEDHKYGFIKAEPCNVFFHASAVEGRPVKAGDAVKYEAAPQAGKNSPRAMYLRRYDANVAAEIDRVFGAS